LEEKAKRQQQVKVSKEKLDEEKVHYEEPTKQDLKYGLSIKHKLTLDKRSHWRFFWDHATDSSSLLSLIYKKTLITPYYISAFVFFNRIVLDITLNALFFNDKQIEDVHHSEEEVNIYLNII